MECLVNVNLTSNCPNCGGDISGEFNASQAVDPIRCEKCQTAISNALANNNPLYQIPHDHNDIIPVSNITRSRHCSHEERPGISSSDFPSTIDVPSQRPRSSSSPNSIQISKPPPPGPHPSKICNGFPCQCQDTSNSGLTPLSENVSGMEATDLTVQTCDKDLTLSTALPSQPEGSDRQCHVTHENLDQVSESRQICPKCGGAIRSDIPTSQVQQDNFFCLQAESNLNTQTSQLSDSRSDGPSSSPQNTVLSLPEVTLSPPHSHHFTQELVSNQNQKYSLTNKPSSWGIPLPETPQDSRSPSIGCASAESFSGKKISEDVDALGSDLASSKRNSEPPVVKTPLLDNFYHNMEHNKQTTGHTGVNETRNGKHFLKDKQGLQPLVSSHRSRRPHNLDPGAMDCDSSFSRLPRELLSDLHSLDYINDDLSADVVHALLFRNYDIKELLGKGISSTVRRVTEKTTGVEYAVKIIDISGEKGETAQVEQTKKDTFREIQILRMCAGHPNIIELHDVFETPTFIFLVFELCRKGELFDYLTSVVSLSEKRTRIFMRQLIEAVSFFHNKNVVHRDLKPENILLDDNLNIKVSDFGFATVIDEGEELVELCGTPGYLAPEVLAHSMYENVSGYGKEVDMWACGVIMYTLLCGAPPFWNRRQMMMLRAIMNADYTFNSPEWDDITDAPKNLIQKLLVVNPHERLTAKQSLLHPFFHSQFAEEKKFDGRRKFRAGVFCVLFYLRLSYYYKHPPPISAQTVRKNPYSIKVMRKVIDTCAFGMYKHWVKRVDNQNRAALFEHTLRDDWKHNLMTLDGVKA